MKWLKGGLIVAICALAVLCAYLVLQITRVPRAPIMQNYHHRRLPPLNNSTTSTSTDISLIRPWMTFDYLNRIFNLLPAYLKTSLSIEDSRYPNLSLQQYATDAATSSTQAVVRVQNAISDYASTP